MVELDGPWQVVGRRCFPLGGLILSPGVTAHLNPFEAEALRDHMQQAIESTILAWVRDHDLSTLPPIPVKFDRRGADRKAKAMIATWAMNELEMERFTASRSETQDCCSNDTTEAPCDACRKGPDHD